MKRGLWAMAGLGLLAIGVELARAGAPALPAVDVKAALVGRGFAALGEVPVTSGGTVHVQRFRAPGCRSEMRVAGVDPSGDAVALVRAAMGTDAAVVRAKVGRLPWPVARLVVASSPPERPDPCMLSMAEWSALLR